MKKIISTLKRNSRRYLSLILVFGMMFSVLFPNMSLDKVSKVYAANPNTEMQPEPQLNREENTSNTTIAYWKSTSVLDFQGKQTDNASYSTSNTNAFKTTYSNGGFQFYYVLSDSQISTTNDGGKVCNFIGGTIEGMHDPKFKRIGTGAIACAIASIVVGIFCIILTGGI